MPPAPGQAPATPQQAAPFQPKQQYPGNKTQQPGQPQMPVQPNAQQSHLMAQVQSLMGITASPAPRSNSTKRHANAVKRERLPSLHFGNLPDSFYDLDLFKFIQKKGHNVVKALVV